MMNWKVDDSGGMRWRSWYCIYQLELIIILILKLLILFFFLSVTYPENIRVCTIAMQTEYSREVGSCTVHFDSVSCVCVMNNEL